MTDISGELGGLTMSAGVDYHMVGDSWVSPEQTWSGESGAVMTVDTPCRVDVSGYIAMSACKFHMNTESPKSGFLKVYIWGYKAENRIENMDFSPAMVDIIQEDE